MPKRILAGKIISKKCDKTLTVLVERTFKHPLYGKTIRKTKKYHVHNPENKFEEGQVINIIESRPISKTKTWIVFEEASEGK